MDADITVEIEFTPGVWTDVSSYLRRGNTRRGKQRSIERAQPGRMTVALSNEDRTFDPEHSGNISPGNLLPNKGIRLSVTHNAVSYPQFTGSIDRIVQKYNGPHDAVAVFECSDGLADLAAAEVKSPLEVFMALDDTPPANSWYRLGEELAPYAFDRGGHARHGVYGGSFESVEGTMWLDSDRAAKFEGGLGYLLLPPGAMPSQLSWSLHFGFKMEEPPPPGEVSYILYQTSWPNGLTIWIDSDGRLNVRFMTDGVITSYVRTVDSTNWANDAWCLFHIRMRSFTVIDIRQFNAGSSQVNPASIIGEGGVADPDAWTIVGNTVYPYALDELMTIGPPAAGDATFDALGFASQAWTNDTVNNRIRRLLEFAKWTAPADVFTDADGFLNATGLNTSVLQHIEAIAESSLARVWVKKDGTFMYLGRDNHILYPYTESQFTLGNGPGEIGYTEMGDYLLDLDTLENVGYRRNSGPYGDLDMTIGGADQESIDAYKLRVGPTVESQFLETDREYSFIMYRLAHLKDPKSHVEAVKILPQRQSALAWPLILNLELADRITFKRHPQNVGDPIETDVIVEGISNDFAPKKWETTLYIDATDAQRYFRFNEVAFGSGDWRFSA